ncbi:MAG TPA: hypothetical protein VMM93_14025, partial [Vicinamibacterales bacterium]|nr:hypothetical protein [Vicinamibacterales bacterium]
MRARTRSLGPVIVLLGAGVAGCSPAAPPPPASGPVAALEAKARRFAPVEINVQVDLPGNEPTVLGHLIRAARLMDGLFLDQVWAGNSSLLIDLGADRTPLGRAEFHYFLLNKGPWSRLDEHEPFLPPARGVPAVKPAQANFYPADATREEVEAWIGSLTGEARGAATGFFTLIRRDAAGGLTAVPYSTAYRNTLVEAASHLRAASALTTEPTLKRFLDTRADA